jgi:hypothetical protein
MTSTSPKPNCLGVWRAVVFVDLVILDFQQRNLGKLMIPKRLLSDTGSIGRCGDNGYFSLMLDKSLGRQGETMAGEIEKRAKLALDAIRKAYGTEAGEFSTTIFVGHHLEQLPQGYWQERTGTASPEPAAVLELLELKSSWGDSDIENFDFSLPGDVTDYVLSAHFNGAGEIDEISMES